MIVKRRGPVRIAELWFDEELTGQSVDLAYFMQRPTPLGGARSTPKYTLLIDLTQNGDSILAGMKANTRYEVRRARSRDELNVLFLPDPDLPTVARFQSFYREFSAHKGLSPIQPARLLAIRATGNLTLTAVSDASSETLVWHAYLCLRGCARLLYSASLYRTLTDSSRRVMISRANRYLHYCDMLAFKASGYQCYDLGGWHAGANGGLLRVNQFKEEFGGKLIETFNCELAVTPTGSLVLAWKRLTARLNLKKGTV